MFYCERNKQLECWATSVTRACYDSFSQLTGLIGSVDALFLLKIFVALSAHVQIQFTNSQTHNSVFAIVQISHQLFPLFPQAHNHNRSQRLWKQINNLRC